MVVLIRDNECFEPRVRNYLSYFDRHHIPYHVIAWNRNGSAKENENVSFFQRHAEYGKRIANIPNKIAWMWFVVKEIIRNRKECTAIHACDIDAAIPAMVIGALLRKKVIFDIFDWISSLTGRGFTYKLVEALQNFVYKRADYVILCEEERKQQTKTVNKEVHILPNIPNEIVSFDEETLRITQRDLDTYDLVISYVGVFDKDRGIENLLACVSKRQNIKLNIAGFGVLCGMVMEYANKYSNISCWGRVEYSVGQAIIKNSHLMAAMYHLTSPLHKYAAPNKYYESLVLEVPMITTENTLVGAKVVLYETGFVINESLDSLENLLDQEDLMPSIHLKKRNCQTVWKNIYSGYYDSFMKNEYSKMID